ncbi:MAG: 5'/3'-nucleotidase SurE [Sphingobacteriales bacterium]|nr:5'/3'-nucleotidase SurE [Sphingobacteriales bacterium]MBP9140839.1 5'/3'-nucleotidase SurE [Chitinophagales bacterium]MDA0199985.1 5'/3'-nucleotidase SurE [Bacteroidota bacterium]MBK6891179.1 5'/3'-nucleotidase SurE [Sphingobacteriales bacterium]MBK7526996.1 5'/3'-nucleotidase SurE [Sphingobacteriales bacterium]
MQANYNPDRLFLITNDDDVTAKGIRVLANVAAQWGRVVVVAPDRPQSAMGHAITINQPLRITKLDVFGNNIEAYACSGTPVDCVKLAVDKILPQKPNFCLSGINHGSNYSVNVIYSGTMSAAMEAAMEHIPAIGFSILDYAPDADLSAAEVWVHRILGLALNNGMPPCNLLNVNIPKLPLDEIKGYKICRQAYARWEEDFIMRQDPTGNKYYWLTGKFINLEPKATDTDVFALENGYLSVVPVQYDLTAYNDIHYLNEQW